jgi:hypothetical protein
MELTTVKDGRFEHVNISIVDPSTKFFCLLQKYNDPVQTFVMQRNSVSASSETV